MQVIVGLGNIGREYQWTRHNIGFLCVDFLAEKYGFSPWKHEKKFFGEVCSGSINGEKILFLKPETYMNLSGKSVAAIRNFYRVEAQDVTVIFDDLDLAFATIRLRLKGGSGGHNGIKSLLSALGSEHFRRIKIGIKTELRTKMRADQFVLGKFRPEEREKFPEIFAAVETKVLAEIIRPTEK